LVGLVVWGPPQDRPAAQEEPHRQAVLPGRLEQAREAPRELPEKQEPAGPKEEQAAPGAHRAGSRVAKAAPQEPQASSRLARAGKPEPGLPGPQEMPALVRREPLDKPAGKAGRPALVKQAPARQEQVRQGQGKVVPARRAAPVRLAPPELVEPPDAKAT